MKHGIFVVLVLTVFLSACAAKTVNVDLASDQGKAVLAIDYRDFSQAATVLLDSLLSSGKLELPQGQQFILTTGQIINDTTQHIDTRQLMAQVEETLAQSGKVVMTSAVGQVKDEMVYEVRELRKSDEFDQTTVQEKSQLVAPDLSLSGKIFQRELAYDKKTKQVEYYLELILTDLKTGLRFWQKQATIVKRGSNKTVIW